MKTKFILFFTIFIVFFFSSTAQAGYWQLSGNGEITGKPDTTDGNNIINSFDVNHIDRSFKTFDWDTEWTRVKYTWDTPPQIIRQDEVIPVSVSYSVTGFFREPRGCSIAFDIFKSGASDARVQLIDLYVKADNPPEGKIINTQIKSPASQTGDRYMQYGCFLLEVSFPYKWVEDGTSSTPTTIPSVTVTPSTSTTMPGVTVTSSTQATGAIKEIFTNTNVGSVSNNPASPTTFTLDDNYKITMITTYHWNYGSGAYPGTIGLKDTRGDMLGTWDATTRPGQGGVPNAYWDVAPDLILGPGTYTIVDSDPSTWSQNSESNNMGIAWVKGTKWSGTPTTGDTPGVTVKKTPSSQQGDFTVSISPTEMTVNPGENIRFTLTVKPEGDFSEPVEIYVKTNALGMEKDYGRVKIINPPYQPYVFEQQVPGEIPKGTTITGYVTAKGGGLERDAGTVTVNVPGFELLLAIGALGLVMLFRKRR